MKLKLITYVKESLFNSFVAFSEFCLLAESIEIDKKPLRDIEQFREGFLGVVPKKIADHFRCKSKKVILIDGVPVTGGFLWDEETLVISPESLQNSAPPELLTALYIEKFFLSDRMHCSISDCFFGQPTQSIGHIICKDCQKQLVNLGYKANALRLLAYLELLKLSLVQFRKLIQKPFGAVIKELHPAIHAPHISIHASNLVIDNMAALDSENRNWITECSKKIYSEKDRIKNNYRSNPDELPKLPTIIVGRRWNSWTPNQPHSNLQILGARMGGGYLISNGEFIIAIDPGYGFLSMLYSFHRITVMDLDAIVITHDHPDHSSELANILSLRYVYKKDDPLPKLKLLVNPSCHYLYRRIFEYYSYLIDETASNILGANQTYELGGIKLETLAMLHDEIFHKLPDDKKAIVISEVGNSDTMGLYFSGKSANGEPFKIAIVGDTSFPETNDDIERLHKFFSGADIAAIHIGSIEKGWHYDPPVLKASSINYGQRSHLGLNGAIKMINLIDPKLALITEFGEEFGKDDFRQSITDELKKGVINRSVYVLPADIPSQISFINGNLRCKCKCGKGFIPLDCTMVQKDDSYGLLYYSYPAGCKTKLDHVNA